MKFSIFSCQHAQNIPAKSHKANVKRCKSNI